MEIQNHNAESIHRIIEAQREFFLTGKTFNVSWRIKQLRMLKKMILSHQDEVLQALAEDLGRAVLFL